MMDRIDPRLDAGAKDDRRDAGAAVSWSSNIPYIMGVVALIVYVTFVSVLLGKVSGEAVNEAMWMRMLHLFTGVETIAFAAAGFFFGREVNRARAESAEKQAAQESHRAADAMAEAAKAETAGKTLARKIRILADAERPQEAKPGLEQARGGASSLQLLAREAEQLFP
jgi:hypothetical protein